MGVKDLQKIIKKYGIPMSQPKYSACIIDGNNLFFTKLASSVSDLYKRKPVENFNGFDIDVISQIDYILKEVNNMFKNHINMLLKSYNVEVIYIMFDPYTDANKYKISADMDYTCELALEETEFKELLLGDDEYIIINIKEEEQNKRSEAQTKSIDSNKLLEKIEKLTLPDETKAIIKNIALQSSYFKSPANYKKLMRLAIASIYNQVVTDKIENVHFIQSKVEADLSIKNLGMKLLKDGAENLLIVSSDTDYYILFADCDNVFCKSVITNNLNIHSPKQVFQALLGKNYSYDAVIRLAPIFGNDYTCGSGLCSPEHVENVLHIMSIDGIPEDCTALRKNTTLYKIASHSHNAKLLEHSETNTKADVETCDKLIFNWNTKFFKRYLSSILVYRNVSIYANQYMEFKMSENVIKTEYTKIQNLLKDIFDGTLYIWGYSARSIHDARFIGNIGEIDIDFDNADALYNILYKKKDEDIDQMDLEDADLPEIESDGEAPEATTTVIKSHKTTVIHDDLPDVDEDDE